MQSRKNGGRPGATQRQSEARASMRVKVIWLCGLLAACSSGAVTVPEGAGVYEVPQGGTASSAGGGDFTSTIEGALAEPAPGGLPAHYPGATLPPSPDGTGTALDDDQINLMQWTLEQQRIDAARRPGAARRRAQPARRRPARQPAEPRRRRERRALRPAEQQRPRPARLRPHGRRPRRRRRQLRPLPHPATTPSAPSSPPAARRPTGTASTPTATASPASSTRGPTARSIERSDAAAAGTRPPGPPARRPA